LRALRQGIRIDNSKEVACLHLRGHTGGVSDLGAGLSEKILSRLTERTEPLPESVPISRVRALRRTDLVELIRRVSEEEARRLRAREEDLERRELASHQRLVELESELEEAQSRIGELKDSQKSTARYELPRLAGLVDEERARADEALALVVQLEVERDALAARLGSAQPFADAASEGGAEDAALAGEELPEFLTDTGVVRASLELSEEDLSDEVLVDDAQSDFDLAEITPLSRIRPSHTMVLEAAAAELVASEDSSALIRGLSNANELDEAGDEDAALAEALLEVGDEDAALAEALLEVGDEDSARADGLLSGTDPDEETRRHMKAQVQAALEADALEGTSEPPPALRSEEPARVLKRPPRTAHFTPPFLIERAEIDRLRAIVAHHEAELVRQQELLEERGAEVERLRSDNTQKISSLPKVDLDELLASYAQSEARAARVDILEEVVWQLEAGKPSSEAWRRALERMRRACAQEQAAREEAVRLLADAEARRLELEGEARRLEEAASLHQLEHDALMVRYASQEAALELARRELTGARRALSEAEEVADSAGQAWSQAEDELASVTDEDDSPAETALGRTRQELRVALELQDRLRRELERALSARDEALVEVAQAEEARARAELELEAADLALQGTEIELARTQTQLERAQRTAEEPRSLPAALEVLQPAVLLPPDPATQEEVFELPALPPAASSAFPAEVSSEEHLALPSLPPGPCTGLPEQDRGQPEEHQTFRLEAGPIPDSEAATRLLQEGTVLEAALEDARRQLAEEAAQRIALEERLAAMESAAPSEIGEDYQLARKAFHQAREEADSLRAEVAALRGFLAESRQAEAALELAFVAREAVLEEQLGQAEAVYARLQDEAVATPPTTALVDWSAGLGDLGGGSEFDAVTARTALQQSEDVLRRLEEALVELVPEGAPQAPPPAPPVALAPPSQELEKAVSSARDRAVGAEDLARTLRDDLRRASGRADDAQAAARVLREQLEGREDELEESRGRGAALRDELEAARMVLREQERGLRAAHETEESQTQALDEAQRALLEERGRSERSLALAESRLGSERERLIAELRAERSLTAHATAEETSARFVEQLRAVQAQAEAAKTAQSSLETHLEQSREAHLALRAERDSLRSERDTLARRLATDEVQALVSARAQESTRESRKLERDTLRSELAAARAHTEATEEALEAAAGERAALGTQRDALRARLEEAAAEQAATQASLGQREAAHAEALAEHAAVCVDLAAANEQLELLRLARDAQDDEEDSAALRATELARQLEQLRHSARTETAERDARLAAQAQTAAKLEHERQGLAAEVARLGGEHSEHQRELASLRESFANREAESLAALQVEHAAQAAAQAEAHSEEIAALEAAREESLRDTARSEVTALETELDVLRARLVIAEQAVADAGTGSAEDSQLREALLEERERRLGLEAILRSQEAQSAQLEDQLASSAEGSDPLLEVEVQRAKSETRRLNTVLNTQRSVQAGLEQRMFLAESEREILLGERDALREDLEGAEEELRGLRRMVAIHDVDTDVLTSPDLPPAEVDEGANSETLRLLLNEQEQLAQALRAELVELRVQHSRRGQPGVGALSGVVPQEQPVVSDQELAQRLEWLESELVERDRRQQEVEGESRRLSEEVYDLGRLLESECWRGLATHRDLVKAHQRLREMEGGVRSVDSSAARERLVEVRRELEQGGEPDEDRRQAIAWLLGASPQKNECLREVSASLPELESSLRMVHDELFATRDDFQARRKGLLEELLVSERALRRAEEVDVSRDELTRKTRRATQRLGKFDGHLQVELSILEEQAHTLEDAHRWLLWELGDFTHQGARTEDDQATERATITSLSEELSQSNRRHDEEVRQRRQLECDAMQAMEELESERRRLEEELQTSLASDDQQAITRLRLEDRIEKLEAKLREGNTGMLRRLEDPHFRRQAERIALLSWDLDSRDSLVHWLLQELDPEVRHERLQTAQHCAEAIRSLRSDADGDSDADPQSGEFLHWLEGAGAPSGKNGG
jgi:hypothetical protein